MVLGCYRLLWGQGQPIENAKPREQTLQKKELMVFFSSGFYSEKRLIFIEYLNK